MTNPPPLPASLFSTLTSSSTFDLHSAEEEEDDVEVCSQAGAVPERCPLIGDIPSLGFVVARIYPSVHDHISRFHSRIRCSRMWSMI